MHGAAHTANAPPSNTVDPRRRAPVSRPGATIRSGHGSRRTKLSPSTTRTKPASSLCERGESTPTTAAAPAPIATKTIVKPRMNGRLATTTRRATPGSPSRAASTFETADRYPGTSGRTQGVITDAKPARNASGNRSATSPPQAPERLVDAPLELGIERSAPVRPRVARVGRRLAPTAPPPDADTEHSRAEHDAGNRQPPREQVEAAARRRREDRLAEGRHELALDLVRRLAARDPGADEDPDPVGDRGVGLVECRVADGTHDLALERGERRARLRAGGGRGPRQPEREDGDREQPHDCSAVRRA